MSGGRHHKTFLEDKSLKFYLEVMFEELQNSRLSWSLIKDKRGDPYRKLRVVDTINTFWYQTYCYTFQRRKEKRGKHQEHNHYTAIDREATISLLTMLIERGYSHANPEKIHWITEEAKLLKEKWESHEDQDE